MADPSLIAVGAASCGLATIWWWSERKAHRAHVTWTVNAVKADGVVSRLARRRHLSRNEPTTSDNLSMVPIVRFRAADGVEYEIDAPDAPRTIGAAVPVGYELASPSSARPLQRTRRLGCAAFLLVVGIALIAIGLAR